MVGINKADRDMVRFLWFKDDGFRDCVFEFYLCLDLVSDLVIENRW